MEIKIMPLLVLLKLASHITCFNDEQMKIQPIPRRILIEALREAGGGPLGAFNEAYMAFTRQGTVRFTDGNSETLKRPVNRLTGPLMDEPSSSMEVAVPAASPNGRGYPRTTRRGTCDTSANGFRKLCSACPATTDLGPGHIPRYINEVLCETHEQTTSNLCGRGKGLCESSRVSQAFLRVTGKPTSKSLKLGELFVESYTQTIRVSCQCHLFMKL